MLFHIKELVLDLTDYMKLKPKLSILYFLFSKAKTINFVFSVSVKIHL